MSIIVTYYRKTTRNLAFIEKRSPTSVKSGITGIFPDPPRSVRLELCKIGPLIPLQRPIDPILHQSYTPKNVRLRKIPLLASLSLSPQKSVRERAPHPI